jgi:hypothetical protein
MGIASHVIGDVSLKTLFFSLDAVEVMYFRVLAGDISCISLFFVVLSNCLKIVRRCFA